METRTVLQILLGLIVSTVVVLGLMILYQLRKSPTVVVDKTVQQESGTTGTEEEKHKWEDREQEAIDLVKAKPVDGLDGEALDRLGDDATVGDVLGDEEFVEETLGYGNLESNGWWAEWWGETKYGAHFYLVQFAFEDAAVEVGPNWLVSLKDEQVVPKNAAARVATDVAAAEEAEYFDKRQQVVSAITKHTFGSGVNLAGTLLLYFVERTDFGVDGEDGSGGETSDSPGGDDSGEGNGNSSDAGSEEDTGEGETGESEKVEGDSESGAVLGWTIQHTRDALFTAYFQWREGGEPTYAEFEFDYERKALKPVNLHASNIMRRGEEFDQMERVDVLPRQFNPEADEPANQWSGKAADAWKKPKFRGHLRAQGEILQKTDLVAALEWLLTTRVEDAETFAECKREKECRWKTEERGEDVYRVKYIYNLGEGDREIAWDVDLEADEEPISPVDRLSELAYRAVVARY